MKNRQDKWANSSAQKCSKMFEILSRKNAFLVECKTGIFALLFCFILQQKSWNVHQYVITSEILIGVKCKTIFVDVEIIFKSRASICLKFYVDIIAACCPFYDKKKCWLGKDFVFKNREMCSNPSLCLKF